MKIKLYLIFLFVLMAVSFQAVAVEKSFLKIDIDSYSTSEIRSIYKYIELNNLIYPELCVEYGIKGLRLAQKEEKILVQFYFTYKIGEAYSKIDILDESMDYTLQAYGLAKITKDTTNILYSLNLLSNLYLKSGMISRAKSYNTTAIEQMKDIEDTLLKAKVLLLRGRIELYSDSVMNAVSYFEQSFFYFDKLKNNRGVADVKKELGHAYLDLNMLSLAMESYKKSKEIYREIEDYRSMLDVQLLLVEIFFKNKKYDEAEKNIDYVIKRSRYYSYDNFLKEGYYLKAKLLEIRNDSKNALAYYKKYLKVRDRVNNAKTQRDLLRLEVEYQNETQKKENAQLQKSVAFQRKVRDVSVFFSVMLVLLIGLIFLYYRYKQQNKLSTNLMSFNRELEKRVMVKTKELEQEVEERRVKTKEALHEKKRAQESDKLKEEFLNAISHEIRTPMNGIIGFASLMKDSNSLEEVKAFSSTIYKKSYDLLDIIEEIIEVARLKSEDISLKKERFTIHNIISDIQYKFEDRVSDGVSWIVDCDAGLEETEIFTDRERLKTVLYHLVINAFKFTEKGYVKFLVTSDENTISFHIKDSGIGMFPEEVRYIFNCFRQVDGGTTRRYGGTGVGLTIVKHLTEMLAGKVKVMSEKNSGSEFVVSFAKDDLSEANNIEQNNSKKRWAGKNILLFDEEKSNTKYLEHYFKQYSVELISANTHQQVLDALENYSVDLILIDDQTTINIDVLIETIKSKHCSAPIILQSSYIESIEKSEMIQAGYDDFLVKPVAFDALKEKIEYYFSTPH
ncbi:MAG: ATP-binding protein [Bacteroidota bacterium]|nr:ATP-binding protein [Bacteroidota bacterium]